jgi:hypothetical protein
MINSEWEQKEESLRLKFKNEEYELLEKHNIELSECEQNLDQLISKVVKPTKKILEVRKRIDLEAKSQLFYEAHDDLITVNRLGAKAQELYETQRRQRIEALISAKKVNQEKEVSSLLHRKKEKLGDLIVRKQSELKVLIAKFKNKTINADDLINLKESKAGHISLQSDSDDHSLRETGTKQLSKPDSLLELIF